LRSQIVSELKQVLQTRRSVGTELIEGGSFAKDTSVKGKSDCDVVLVCPELGIRQFEGLQEEIKGHIIGHFPLACDFKRLTK